MNVMEEKEEGFLAMRVERKIVWSECPDHILERILSTLPLEYIASRGK